MIALIAGFMWKGYKKRKNRLSKNRKDIPSKTFAIASISVDNDQNQGGVRPASPMSLVSGTVSQKKGTLIADPNGEGEGEGGEGYGGINRFVDVSSYPSPHAGVYNNPFQFDQNLQNGAGGKKLPQPPPRGTGVGVGVGVGGVGLQLNQNVGALPSNSHVGVTPGGLDIDLNEVESLFCIFVCCYIITFVSCDVWMFTVYCLMF